MLPASKAPFPWLIVFFRKIESGFIWEAWWGGKRQAQAMLEQKQDFAA